MTRGSQQPDRREPRGAARQVIRGGPVRLVGYGAGIAMSLGTASLTLRHLGVAGAGQLFGGLSALALAAALADFGLAGSGLRDFSVLPSHDRDAYLDRLATLRTLMVGLATGPAIVLATGGIGYDPAIVAGLLAGATATLGMTLVTTANVRVAERLDATAQSLVQLVQSGAGLATTAVLVSVHAELPWFFAFQLPGVLLALTTLKLRVRSSRLPWPRAAQIRPALRLLDRGSVVLGTAVILGVAFYRIGPLALTYLSTPREAGLYGTAFRLADVVEAVAPLLMTIVLPLLATGVYAALLPARTSRTVSVMAPLGSVAAAGVLGGAGVAVDIVGGARFADAATPLGVMSVMVLLAFPTQVYGYALLAERRHAAMLGAVSGAFVATSVGLALMADRHGAVGAAVSLVLGQATLLVAYVAAYGRRHPVRDHARPFLMAMAAFGAAAATTAVVTGEVIRLVVSVAVATAVVAVPTLRTVRSAWAAQA